MEKLILCRDLHSWQSLLSSLRNGFYVQHFRLVFSGYWNRKKTRTTFKFVNKYAATKKLFKSSFTASEYWFLFLMLWVFFGRPVINSESVKCYKCIADTPKIFLFVYFRQIPSNSGLHFNLIGIRMWINWFHYSFKGALKPSKYQDSTKSLVFQKNYVSRW